MNATLAFFNGFDIEGTARTVYDFLSIFESSKCERFTLMNHIYFQIANIFFLLSYFASNSRYGFIYLRLVSLLGCVYIAVWGLKILCSFDLFVWNAIFIVLSVIHILVLLTRVWPTRFSGEIEALYVNVFKPLQVSRRQFKKLVKCIKLVKNLKYQESYARERVTRVEFLSVVLSGKLLISQRSKALHIVFPHQFLDSPEWFGVSTDDFFQVSITAMEESKILLWHRDKLKLSIIRDKFLQTVLDHILSRDVVNKLMQTNDAITASTNGHLPTNYEDDAYYENKSSTIVKRTGDGNGITALIDKQLQGENSNELVPLLNRRPYFQHNDQLSKLVLHKIQ